MIGAFSDLGKHGALRIQAAARGRPLSLRHGHGVSFAFAADGNSAAEQPLPLSAHKSKIPYVGGYARSVGPDLFGGWHYRYERAAYSTTVHYSDGEGGADGMELDGRERPKLFFDDAGKPALLVNGVRFPPNPDSKGIFTFVQPVEKFMD